jgi:metal-responsive CopG/Arc/MetJ family transcriptional regulator
MIENDLRIRLGCDLLNRIDFEREKAGLNRSEQIERMLSDSFTDRNKEEIVETAILGAINTLRKKRRLGISPDG